MQRFPTNYLILEGPDLAGKTSFYQALHDKTGYRWNIQDRSALSMLVYARFYGRDTFAEVERLNKELKDLNNRFVILLPPWDEIGRRFNERGDEIQSLVSLKKVYRLFEEAAQELQKYPNVFVVRAKDTLTWVGRVISHMAVLEMASPEQVANCVLSFARSSKNMEASPISLVMYDDGKFKCINNDVLEYEKEKDYYADIMSDITKKIANELKGDNEYFRKETITSRRFVYSDSTCISFAQFLVRDGLLDCHIVMRSSNAKDTLKYDLPFLYILCNTVYNQLELNEIPCRIRINFNSAHIIID